MTHRRALARLADLYLALADKPAPTDDERLVRAAIQAALEERSEELWEEVGRRAKGAV